MMMCRLLQPELNWDRRRWMDECEGKSMATAEKEFISKVCVVLAKFTHQKAVGIIKFLVR